MQNLTFKQTGSEFVNISEICLYSSESANINIRADFDFSYAQIKLNNQNIGKTATGQIGIHATKFRDGLNELAASFYDESGKFLQTLKTTIAKRPSIRGQESIEQEYTLLTEQLGKLQTRLTELEDWKKQIDNERNGF